jgi:RecB family exonuclease
MLDRVFSDLLPEGVGPDDLAKALESLATDDFATSRNEWVVGTYRSYLEALEGMGRADPRSIPSLLAKAIEEGGLSAAVGDAERLHVYGMLYDLRSRRKFVRALMSQPDIDVVVYTLDESQTETAPGPWSALDVPAEQVESKAAPTTHVQPAPDAMTEAGWVAAQIKKILVAGGCEPHEVAVLARSGREDTHGVATALTAAGIPVSVRARSALSEVSALKAFLGLFAGAGQDWAYQPLRACVVSPYFDMGLRSRTLDRLAQGARTHGLAAWRESVEGLLSRAAEDPKTLYGTGLFEDHLETDAKALSTLEADLAWLSEARSERAWVERTLAWLREGPFHFRTRLCKPVGEDWDIVRFDQRGVLQVERLLREWLDLADDGSAVTVVEWHRLFHRLLAGSELTLSTPMDKGVQVLEAQDSALTPFRHTYVIHANHGEFPREVRAGGVFSAEERAKLAADGLPITHRSDEARRERTLWRGVTSAPDVTVLYRTTSYQGTPLLPSLMVPQHDPSTELPRTRLPRWAAVTPGQDRRQAALALAHGADPSAGVSTDQADRLRHSVLVAYGEAQRPGKDSIPDDHPGLRPNPWNGALSDPIVLEYLAEHFGASRVWSASQLEAYGGCPFNYLVGEVLKIDEVGQAEEETTALTFGDVAHKILEKFYSQVKGALPSALDGHTTAILTAVTHTVLEERESSDDWLGDPVLWRNARAQIEQVIHEYVAWELEHMEKKGERPVEVELEFGFGGKEFVEISGTDLSGAIRTLRLRGRIDRVDATERNGDPVHRVLDYKSGWIPKLMSYQDGSLLQVPLYVEVINTLGFNGVAGRYRALKKPGRPQNGAEAKVGDKNYSPALQHAMSIPTRILRGLFEPVKAGSQDWAPWDPGAEITRSRAALPKGRSRFDE